VVFDAELTGGYFTTPFTTLAGFLGGWMFAKNLFLLAHQQG
jgi:hypothetical protein